MKLYDTRNAMIQDLLPKNSIGCEVGVFAGEFAQILVDSLAPKYLLLIDPWEKIGPMMCSGDQDGNNMVQFTTAELYARVSKQFEGSDTVRIVKDFSYTILPTLPDSSLDWIYIDGDHSYNGVIRDLTLAESKIKAGGFICGHDFEMNYAKTKNHYEFGVKQAVEEFCSTRGWHIVAKGMDGCVSYALQKV